MNSNSLNIRWLVLLGVASLVVASLATPALAADPVGVVLSSVGPVEVKGPSRDGWQQVALRDDVFAEDILKTGAGGRVKILFRDDTLINLGEESEVTVSEFIIVPEKGLRKATLNLGRGVGRFLVGGTFPDEESRVEVNTPTAVIGVRGTTFFVQILTLTETLIYSSVDPVEVGNILKSVVGKVKLSPSFVTSVKEGLAPDPPRPFDPAELQELIRATHVPTSAPGLSGAGGSGPPGTTVAALAKSGVSKPGLAATLDRGDLISDIPQEIQENIQESVQEDVQEDIQEDVQEDVKEQIQQDFKEEIQQEFQQSLQQTLQDVTQEQVTEAVIASLSGVFDGRYIEDFHDQVRGRNAGEFILELQQKGDMVTGTLVEFDPGGTAQREDRPVTLELDGDTFTGNIVDGQFNIDLTGTVEGDTLSGTYNGVDEDGDPISGTWSATKQ